MDKIKSKLNSKNLIIILGVLLALILMCLVFFGFNVNNNNEIPKQTLPPVGNLEKPDENVDLNNVIVDLVEYDYYEFDEFDFGFIISKFRFKAQEPINLQLDNFVTSENVILSDVSTYVSKLEEQSYYLGKQNVFFEVVSQENTCFANIFIPVLNKENKDLTININNEKIEFDLSKVNNKKEMFTYSSDDIITDGKTYQMSVSSAFEITGEQFEMVYDDGYVEDYTFSSTARLYAFKLDVVSLWGDEVVIEDAIYIVDGTNVEFDALQKNIVPQKYDNIIGTTIKDKTTGTIIIPTYSNNEDKLSFKGKLKLKLSNNENYIDIIVDL